jgi:hypothetical protein
MLRVTAFVLISLLAGCGGSSAPFPQTQSVTSFERQQAKQAPLCIKLAYGDPDPKTPKECSGRTYAHGVNTDLCYPTQANPCTGLRKTATVLATEKRYKGTIFAAIRSAKLPKAVLRNPAYPGALCGDKGTASYSEDVLDVHPIAGKGPKRHFTITDSGPRTGAPSASSDCSIIFYDKANNVMPFTIVMLTVPG